jgi:4-hydroxy-tetrahydrodipicolinate synthase
MDHKQSEDNMIRSMSILADSSPIPIWLYNNRNRGRGITNRIIQELRNHDNIHGVKIGGNAISDLVNASMCQTDNFQVVGAGGAGQCFTMLSLGCKAHTASDASCWPEEYVKLFELYNAGDINAAREQQFRLVKLNKDKGNTAKLDNGEFSAEEKYILSIRKICNEYVNPSYRLLTDSEKQKVDRALNEYGFPWAPSLNGAKDQ